MYLMIFANITIHDESIHQDYRHCHHQFAMWINKCWIYLLYIGTNENDVFWNKRKWWLSKFMTPFCSYSYFIILIIVFVVFLVKTHFAIIFPKAALYPMIFVVVVVVEIHIKLILWSPSDTHFFSCDKAVDIVYTWL